LIAKQGVPLNSFLSVLTFHLLKKKKTQTKRKQPFSNPWKDLEKKRGQGGKKFPNRGSKQHELNVEKNSKI